MFLSNLIYFLPPPGYYKSEGNQTLRRLSRFWGELYTKRRKHFVRASVIVNHWIDGSWHVFHTDYGEIPCVLYESIHRVTYSICKKGDIFMLR